MILLVLLLQCHIVFKEIACFFISNPFSANFFFLFSCLVNTPNTILNRGGDGGSACFVLYFSGNDSIVSPLNKVLALDLSSLSPCPSPPPPPPLLLCLSPYPICVPINSVIILLQDNIQRRIIKSCSTQSIESMQC